MTTASNTTAVSTPIEASSQLALQAIHWLSKSRRQLSRAKAQRLTNLLILAGFTHTIQRDNANRVTYCRLSAPNPLHGFVAVTMLWSSKANGFITTCNLHSFRA